MTAPTPGPRPVPVAQNQSVPPQRRHRIRQIFPWALMALPACIFYAIVFREAVRIPILDDYDVILRSLIWIHQHHRLSAKLLFLLTAQHNGYKLVFENTVVFLEYSILGKIHFLPLVVLGDLFPVVLFLAVIAMTRVDAAQKGRNWVLLIPVAWMIFQLQYASALDFASSSLQHLAVVAFALLSILFLNQTAAWTFAASACALLLSIASSPNGFFVVPVGILVLLQKRRWKDLSIWLVVAAAALILYLFRYSHNSSVAGSGSAADHFAHPNLAYALSFLGASAAGFSSIAPSLVLGVFFCSVFALAIQRRYFLENPSVFYSMLFILINAVAVSGLRSDMGVVQSLASRYRTYSNLYLAFSYIFVLENLLPAWRSRVLRRGFLGMTLAVSVAFCSLSDLAGARFLHGKKLALTASYRSEWQGDHEDPTALIPQANPALVRQIRHGVYQMDLPVFREAVQDGIFDPPANP